MTTKPSSYKSMYTIAGIIIFAAMAYFMFAPAAPQSDSLLQAEQQSDPESNARAQRVLSLLNQIESLRIDTTVFDGEAYQSLIDYTVPVPELVVGRPNPFAPLPGAPALPATTPR